MASHYVGLALGVSGFADSDFIEGTSSSGSASVELRVDDSAGLRRIDVVKAIKAIQRRIEMVGLSTSLPNAPV